MAKIFIPAQWRDLTGTTTQLELEGASLKQIIDALERVPDTLDSADCEKERHVITLHYGQHREVR